MTQKLIKLFFRTNTVFLFFLLKLLAWKSETRKHFCFVQIDLALLFFSFFSFEEHNEGPNYWAKVLFGAFQDLEHLTVELHVLERNRYKEKIVSVLILWNPHVLSFSNSICSLTLSKICWIKNENVLNYQNIYWSIRWIFLKWDRCLKAIDLF